jgi:hypothetical protein
MARSRVLVFAAFVLASCASTPSSTARAVQDGDPAVVNRDCKLLGTVNGRSLFGLSEQAKTEGAVANAREKAAELGATHVVFLKVDTSGMLNTGNATARAYRCDIKGPQ